MLCSWKQESTTNVNEDVFVATQSIRWDWKPLWETRLLLNQTEKGILSEHFSFFSHSTESCSSSLDRLWRAKGRQGTSGDLPVSSKPAVSHHCSLGARLAVVMETREQSLMTFKRPANDRPESKISIGFCN